MYVVAQMNATIDPIRFAATNPHHAPGKPISKIIEKIHTKGSVNMTLLKMVTIRAFNPFPVPWNMDDESMPMAIPGKYRHVICRNVIISFVRRAEDSDMVNNTVIVGAKKKINTAIIASITIPIFIAYINEIFSFL